MATSPRRLLWDGSKLGVGLHWRPISLVRGTAALGNPTNVKTQLRDRPNSLARTGGSCTCSGCSGVPVDRRKEPSASLPNHHHHYHRHHHCSFLSLHRCRYVQQTAATPSQRPIGYRSDLETPREQTHSVNQRGITARVTECPNCLPIPQPAGSQAFRLAMAKAILSRTNDHDVKHNFSLRTRLLHTALQRRKGDPYLGRRYP